MLNGIVENIIPAAAASPGANEAVAGAYMLVMVNDCFNIKRRNLFIKVLNTFDQACRQQYQASFIDLTAEQKKEFTQQLNKEAQTNSKDGGHYFSIIKSLTINGYITFK